MQCFYNHATTGEQLELVQTYDSYGTKRVIYEDDGRETWDVTLEEFEEVIGETLV